MNIYMIEEMMYRVSDIFLMPVLIAIIVLFIYSLFALGKFSAQYLQRRNNRLRYHKQPDQKLPGYDLYSYFIQQKSKAIAFEELEIYALKKLEIVRMATRIAPMLGLIATMIPMGPALKSLADGNIQGISDNLVIAFSSVIFGLVIATITFWIASVQKRWLAVELIDCQKLIESQKKLDSRQEFSSALNDQAVLSDSASAMATAG